MIRLEIPLSPAHQARLTVHQDCPCHFPFRRIEGEWADRPAAQAAIDLMGFPADRVDTCPYAAANTALAALPAPYTALRDLAARLRTA